MSDSIETVFNEYTRLRLHGLEASEAIRALHPHVQELDEESREELARIMRAWENQRTEKISFEDRKKLLSMTTQKDKPKPVLCQHCGKENPEKELICYSCGKFIKDTGINATDILPRDTGEFEAHNDAHFGEHSVLVLNPAIDIEPLVLRPQLGRSQLTFGRNGRNIGNPGVDVDLEPVGAKEQGISRLHAAIAYDDISETLSLFDMGSTNGSYINGQKLQANERRTLRHGDRIRFGRLNFQVFYR